MELDHLEFSRDKSWVTVHVRVDEGELFVVSSVRIAGFRRVPDATRSGLPGAGGGGGGHTEHVADRGAAQQHGTQAVPIRVDGG